MLQLGVGITINLRVQSLDSGIQYGIFSIWSLSANIPAAKAVTVAIFGNPVFAELVIVATVPLPEMMDHVYVNLGSSGKAVFVYGSPKVYLFPMVPAQAEVPIIPQGGSEEKG